jgi:hypothetical protein
MLRDNMSAQEDRFDKDTVEEKTVVKTQPYEKPEPRDGMPKSNSKPVTKSHAEAVFEASIEDYQGGKLTMDEEPKLRDERLKANPRYKNVSMDRIDAVRSNTECEADIKIQQGRELDIHEKPETRDVMNDITDVIMRITEYEANIQGHKDWKINMLKTNPKEINMSEVPKMRMLKEIPRGKDDKNVDIDHVMDEKPEMNVNVLNMEINVFEEAEKGILKTSLKGKNTVNTPIKDPNAEQW